jgi:subtilisin family serine protease
MRSPCSLLAVLLVLPLLAAAAVAQEEALPPASPKIAPEVLGQLDAAGTVRVLVRYKLPERDGSQHSRQLRDALRQMDIAFSQVAVKRRLAGRRHEVKHDFRRIPWSALELDPEALAELEDSGLVESVTLDTIDAPLLADSTALVGADVLWGEGYDGAGQVVAVLDTGVESNHPFLSGAVLAEACFSGNGNCPNGQASQIGPGAGAACSYASACDHGTHVAGIVAGTPTVVAGVGTVSGVAPGAGIVAIQVFSQFIGTSCGSSPSPCALSYGSDQIAALEHVLDLSGSYQIAAVNMSLGGGKYRSQSLCDAENAAKKAAIDNLREAGIATVISSGNDGYNNDVSAPACISSAVAVGSTTKSDAVSSFSNHGGLVDLMAPGSSILSSVTGSVFASKSGTSMAAPHMAGAWAVLKDLDPSLTVDEILTALKRSGPNVTRAKRKRRRLDLADAEGEFDRLWLRNPASRASLATGDTVTLAWFPQSGASTYRLFYSKNNGKSWSTVVENLLGTSYDWTVPADWKNRATVRLSMKAYDAQGQRVGPARAKNPGRFTTQTVRVSSHNTSTILVGGGTTTVTWDTNDTLEPITSTRIYVRKKPGTAWSLVEELNGNPGTYSLTLPVYGADKGRFRIRVDLRGASGSMGKDNNDAELTLLAP